MVEVVKGIDKFGMTRHICNIKTDMRLIARIYNTQSSDQQKPQKDSHPFKKNG